MAAVKLQENQAGARAFINTPERNRIALL